MINVFKKIKSLIVLCVFSYSFSASALINLGFKGGLGLSKTVTEPTSNTGNIGSGLIGGISIDLDAELIGLVIDVLYAQRTFEDSSKTVLNTLHIPVQLKFNLAPAIFTSAGGYYGLGLGDKFAANNLKTADYGAVFGLGFALPFGVSKVTLEGRYNLGLANVLDGGSDSLSVKNRHIDILLGLQF